jgi:hypothetical protein
LRRGLSRCFRNVAAAAFSASRSRFIHRWRFWAAQLTRRPALAP